MQPLDLFSLYERLYFHELDRRERLASRLNLPLAVLAGIVGALSFMLQNAPQTLMGNPYVVFWAFFSIALLSTLAAGWFFRKAWFGHTDKLLPTANETEAYKQKLEKLYEPYEEKDKLVDEALRKYFYEYYMKFSSENTTNNDNRAYNLYRTTVSITVALFFVLAAFVPFSYESYVQTTCTPPREILQMSKKPPPPPPPPPPRNVKGEVRKSPPPGPVRPPHKQDS